MSQNKLFIASSNIGKIKEFEKLFPNYEILSLVDKDISIEETGTTFKENAYIKASTISKMFNCITISDDSGLCVNALNGRPGIFSARYTNTNNIDDSLLKVISELNGKTDRSAYYECVICLCFPNLTHYYFSGKLEGEILGEFRGDNGFGYDKIFYLPKLKKTAAEITIEEKNEISHRAIAVKKLIESGKL